MDFYDKMMLTDEIKAALDWGLFRMYIMGPALYYGFYRALMKMANYYIRKYSGEDDDV